MKGQTGLLGRHGQQQAPRRSRGLSYVMLSGVISVAIALTMLLATSHRMVHLGSQGGSRVTVHLKTLDDVDPDLAAAERLASEKPDDIESYFAVDRAAESERLMRLAHPEWAFRLDNARERQRANQLAEENRAKGALSQDSLGMQQDGSRAEADPGQGNVGAAQDNKGVAQMAGMEDIGGEQQDGRASKIAGQQARADTTSHRQETETGNTQSSDDTQQDMQRAKPAEQQARAGAQQAGAASSLAATHQPGQDGDGSRLGEGIWVIDLTVDDPAALKDGEDTYMIKMWKELEEQRKQDEVDPAKEAGSAVLELEASDPVVQRLRALGAQARAKLRQPMASENAAREGGLQKEARTAGDSDADSASPGSGDSEGSVDTPLRLVTLFRDRETYKEPENPHLATWKQDLDRRLLELEEAAAVRRKELERERAHLFPHIPLVEGILENALEPGAAVKGLYRPAAAEDLLDGAELEQRLRDEGRLDDILRDPELMPNWEVQLQMQQAG